MPEPIHRRISRERSAALPDAAMVRDYRSYAEGKQRATISAEQKAILGSVYGHEFADNVCDLILSTAASRLELTGWRVDDEATKTFLDDLYVKNQVADFSYDVHYSAPRDGNHAIGIRWLPDSTPKTAIDANPETEAPETRGSGRVTIHHEPWWNGNDTGEGVFVAYDASGFPAYAVKDFTQVMGGDTGPVLTRRRRVIYWPDHFERYIHEGAGWSLMRLDSDPSTSPDGIVPWEKADGSPLGIPIIHVPNGRFGKAPYGVSDLAGGIMGQQDHLNDLQWDLVAAARLTAFQMIAATGISSVEKLRVGPGRILQAGSADARFTPIPAGDLSQIINAIKQKLESIARNSATPAHEITGGDWPSGVALLRSEIRFIGKIQRMAKTIGPAWATVAHRATEVANTFGGLGLNEDALITAVFAPPEKLDALALAQVDKERVEVYARLQDITDPELMAKTGLVTIEEANAITAARQSRADAIASVAAF